MKKTYLLDTSTIVSNPNCLDILSNSNIIIHTKVIYELDSIKKRPNEAGKHARVFIKKLDNLTNNVNINDFFSLKNNSKLKIISDEYKDIEGDPSYIDNHILACAKNLNKENPITLVSDDINLRLRAKIAGIEAVSLNSENIKINDMYQGVQYIIDTDLGNLLKEKKIISCFEDPILNDILPNEAVIFENEDGKVISLGRRRNNEIKIINTSRVWNIKSKNIEQALALDLLLDKEIPLVSLVGLAGSGKTLISIAAGLEQVIGQKKYNQLIIYRPIQPIGNDLGYMPGSLDEKLSVWTGAIKDAFEVLTPNKRKDWKSGLGQYQDLVSIEAITFLRGRSIPNSFIIVDEAQNTSNLEIKTLLTRVSKGSKIVLTGDVEQIDSKNLDIFNNGLSVITEKFKKSELSGHITLKQCERSALAEEAAKLL